MTWDTDEVIVRLLGAPQLRLKPAARSLDARPAALLAYLAAEGPRDRAACAELLWPNTPHATARNNLVQLLRRLTRVAGGDLVVGQRTLFLAPGVYTDLSAPPTPDDPDLLSGLDTDFSAPFDDWLRVQREARQVQWAARVAQDIATLIERGDLAQALALAERRVERDPLDEDAYGLLMRLHHLSGNRAAAMQVYGRLRSTLQLELGMEPSPEAARLARDLGTQEPPTTALVGAADIPLSLLRPPVLLGQEDAWAQMEAGWTAGAGVALIGPSGSGKSRLAVDFARVHPEFHVLLLQGRPGDQNAAYTTHARTYRQTLNAFPEVAAALPDWARTELARLIPELGPAPGPLTSEQEKLRFYDAKYEVLRQVAARGPVVLISDDLHFMDDASIEAGAYVYAKFWGNSQVSLRSMFCYREGALSTVTETLSRQMYESGMVRPIHLAPLNTQATEALLQAAQITGSEDVIREVQRFADGNPQLTLELAKYLHERGTFDVAAVREAAGRTLGSLLSERLAQLSSEARQAAQAAAVLRNDFTLEQVAEVLDWNVMGLLGAWEELERAQVVRGERFAHDLIAQAMEQDLQRMPVVYALLHRKVASVLGAQGAAAARIAAHWQAGGQPAQAALWWERAAQQAENSRQLTDACAQYASAAAAFQASGDTNRAREMTHQRDRAASLIALRSA
ncbi:BTAD domain-containing putative transcriptional regulator [Deinococcus humi]|uniref:DNA-binding SARP family transcriptional activator/energy-coupling factor transporter ATP-binding protein EcfA2 n=1 Tax=Deinococcus humi TaxID=662880 RepID=A0A7W8NGD1_9DEIO|nr:BTAD domain-containing putative transcriptional regulator [Deinococcus humi]MBB5363643.1 DNA-binding SARP family transcriptional activator/energy-coupling factor transporter ATP-binding protein EcfA2 [Deinococcus humi]GGO29926.1 hypothetical protein GCM10008949_24100 [Deinococcus humi]